MSVPRHGNPEAPAGLCGGPHDAGSKTGADVRTGLDDCREPPATDAPEGRAGYGGASAEAIRNRVIEAHLGLVAVMARRYEGLGLPPDDLVQEGNIGLIAAARTFDRAQGMRFSAHAARWIRETICRALSQKSRPIRIPLRLLTRRREAAHVQADLEQEYRNDECATGRHHVHTTEDDARAIGVEPETLRATIRLVPDVVSLDAPCAAGGALWEALPDARSPNPRDEAARSEELRRLREGIAHLPFRLQHVLKRRYGLTGDGERGLREVGEELHLTAERVRQLQQRALGMLRRDLERRRSRRPPEPPTARPAQRRPRTDPGRSRFGKSPAAAPPACTSKRQSR